MTYDISTIQGDTWEGAQVEIILNDSPLDLTDSQILIQVKNIAKDLTPQMTLAATLTDPTAGKFRIDAVIVNLFPREYVYDIQITLASGKIITPIISTFTVTADVSRN